MSESEYEEKRQALIEDAKQDYSEKKEQQNELKEAVASEHAGDKIETTANLAGDITVDISLFLDGELMDRMADVEAEIEAWENDDPSFRGASEVADNCAQVLADVVEEPHMTKAYFYEVYQETGLEGLGGLVENVFTSIEKEQERMQGAVDGFRA